MTEKDRADVKGGKGQAPSRSQDKGGKVAEKDRHLLSLWPAEKDRHLPD